MATLALITAFTFLPGMLPFPGALPDAAAQTPSAWEFVDDVPGAAEGYVPRRVWTAERDVLYVLIGRSSPTVDAAVWRYDHGAWHEELAMPGYDGTALFGTGSSDIYAAFWADPDVQLYRYDGASWNAEALPPEIGYITAIAGVPGDVQIGDSTDAARNTGSGWTVLPHDPGINVWPRRLTYVGPDEAYMASCWGHGWWDGVTWEKKREFDFCDVAELWGARTGAGDLNLWAVGTNNFGNGIRIWRYDEAARSFGSKYGAEVMDPPGTTHRTGHATSIWGSGPDDVWVSAYRWVDYPTDASARIYHYDGAGWTSRTDFPTLDTRLFDVWGSAADDVWFVVEDGRLLHYGQPLASPPPPAAWDFVTQVPGAEDGRFAFKVWTGERDVVYVLTMVPSVPFDAQVWRFDHGAWHLELDLPGHYGNFVFGTGPTDVYAGGYTCVQPDGSWTCPAGGADASPVYHFDGTGWTELAMPPELGGVNIHSIAGVPGEVQLGAANRYVVRDNGSGWTVVYDANPGAGLTVGPSVMTMLAPDEGYLASCWGHAWWDGVTWTKKIEFDFCDLYDIWGARTAAGDLNLWAAGNNNFQNGVRIWRYDEATRSFGGKYVFEFGDPPTGTGQKVGNAGAMWGAAPDDVYATGCMWTSPADCDVGRIYHSTGDGTWAELTGMGPIASVVDVWGTTADDVWFSLRDGQLLHYGATPSYAPLPELKVAPANEGAWGHGWTPGATLTLTIDGGAPYTTTVDGNGDWGFDLNPFDLQAGMQVIAADGTSTKSLEVTPLTVTGLDAGLDQVYGTAAPGSGVHVGIHGLPDSRDVTADASGNWMADFSVPGDGHGPFDIGPGTAGPATQWDVDGDSTNADWWVPNPSFTVEVMNEQAWGWDFPANTEVLLVRGTDDWVTFTDEWGNFHIDLQDPFGFDAGDYVTVTAGAVSKDHTVTNLAVTAVDPVANTVTGSADPGTDVWVDVGDGIGQSGRTVTADGGGVWVADFDLPGDGGGTHDIQPGSNGWAMQSDGDGDSTQVGWYVPNPHFNVSPRSGEIWANEFQPEGAITITIDAVDFGPYPTDEWGNFDGNNFGLSFPMAVDSVVSITDGITTKDHTVTNLAVTSVDELTDTVTGTADPGDAVEVHGPGASLEVITDGAGVWTADFTGLIDLQPGDGGHAAEIDGDGDQTHAGWHVPDPWFTIDPGTGELWAYDFEPDGTVTITIDAVDFGPYPTDQWGNFDANQYGLSFAASAGSLVVVDDGTTAKDHTVTDLTITGYDEAATTVSGTADPGDIIDVWENNSGASLQVTADPAGNWTSDFTGLTTFEPGDGGGAGEPDTDGDRTQASWRIPDPRFKAMVDDDNLSGWDWLPDATVDITVDGGAPYSFTTDEWGNFGDGVPFDVEVGQYLVATDGASTKDMTVRNLVVTAVDADLDLVTGTSEPGDEIHVNIHDQNGPALNVTADAATGDWAADFAGLYDIVQGTSGSAHYWEPDGDETERTWRISDPHVTASVSHDEIWATDFPDEPAGQMLYYRLDDPATPGIDFESDMPLIVSHGQTEAGDRSFGRFDVKAGDTLTVRNRPFADPLGDGVEKVLAISHVEVTGLDSIADVITGYADPAEGAYVCAWSNDAQLCSGDAGFAWDAGGDWTADFGSVGSDVQPGDWNSASQYDGDGDETHFWWNLPPWIAVELAEADAAGNPVYGAEWPHRIYADQWIGPVVTLEINGSFVADLVLDGYGPDLEGVLRGHAVHDFDAPLGAGDVVRMYDGTDDKSIVVEPLTIDGIFEFDALPPDVPNSVVGTAAAGRGLGVTLNSFYGWWAERHIGADASGDWLADFGNPGQGWREQWTASIGSGGIYELAGGSVNAWFHDDDNDQIRAVVHPTGEPRLFVFRGNDRVEALDFPNGATVTVEIDDPATPEAPDYTDSGVAAPRPGEPWSTLVVFELGDFTVPDDATVTGTDGVTTVAHVVPASFTVGTIDQDADTVSGTAPAGAQVAVQADGQWRYVTADAAGDWLADYAVSGPQPGEENLVDIQRGSSGRAVLATTGGHATEILWRISTAAFNVDPSPEFVWAYDFTPGATVTATVDQGSGPVPLPGSPFATDPWGNFGTDWDPGQLDLQPGDVVTLTDGDTTKQHTITPLEITAVDIVSNVVSGVGEAGGEVNVHVHGQAASRIVTVDAAGDWSTDFGDPGDTGGTHDLQPGDNLSAFQCDADDDCTQDDWHIAAPQFRVDPTTENVWGNEFAANGAVTVTVNGADFGPYPTDEWGNFGLPEPLPIDVAAGDTVTVSDGTDAKDHVVTTLTIESADPDTNVVSGTAAAGSEVWVEIHGYHEAARSVTADASGNWSTDFDTPGHQGATYDFGPGDGGYASQCDADNDCTQIDWRIPAAHFNVDARNDHVWGHEWLPNTDVTVTVDGTPYGPFATDQWGNFGTEDWENRPDIQPATRVEVSDGATTKAHDVTTLAITAVDDGADTVSGVADPGTGVDIWVHDSPAWRHVVAGDGLGEWTADFANPGDEPGEQDIADLVRGTNGNSAQCDDDGDCTFAWWQVSLATIGADPADNVVRGWLWTPGSTVTITVDDPDTVGADLTVTRGPLDLDMGQFWDVDLDGILTLEPGFEITADDGTQNRTLTVTYVTVTSVDPATERVTGTADAGAEVWVGIEGWGFTGMNPQSYRIVTADGGGFWEADFSVAWQDQPAFDVQGGTSGAAARFEADGDLTEARWQVPNSRFNVDARHDSVWGHEWHPGASVTVTIGAETWTFPTNEWGDFWSDWDPAPDLADGTLITVADALVSKQHLVTGLTVTGADAVTDTVGGTAAAGSSVDVWVHGPHNVWRTTIADGAGFWSVDFGQPGGNPGEEDTADLQPGNDGNSAQCDADGDCTFAHWRIANPSIEVQMTHQQVNGYEWDEGVPVTLTIDDPGTTENPDYEATASPGPAEWDPSQTFVQFTPFEGQGFEMQPGFLVAMSDGQTTKTHTITPLAVTAVDAELDTVSGYASPGARVQPRIWTDEGPVDRAVTADGGGFWTADFSVEFEDPEFGHQPAWDIQPGTNGTAWERDGDGDTTQVDWQLANPTFSVRMSERQVHGYEWDEGVEVTLTIDDPNTPEIPDYEATATPGPAEWDPNQTFVVFAPFEDQGFEIQPGFEVTLTNGAATKTHTVTSLEVTDVDRDADTVSGVASPEAWVNVHIHDSGADRNVQADADGLWTVDFSAPGPEPWEQETYDIDFGTNGEASESDDDGDTTQVEWRLVNPTFTVSAEGDWLDGDEWAAHAPITVTFEGGFVATAETDEGGHFDLDLWDQYDVEPGRLVTVTDGATTKTHVVTEVAVTAADPDTDTVSGTAAPGSTVEVEVHEPLQGLAWEHLVFQLGPGRFDRNPDSLNEHLEFRQAVAHAINLQALADGIPGAGYAIDSHVDAYLPELGANGWAQYGYDPTRAADLVDGLCSTLGRDCTADPPVAVFTTTGSADRLVLADLLQPMLSAAGIELVIELEDGGTFFGTTIEEGTFDLGEWAWADEPTHYGLRNWHQSIDPDERWGTNYYGWSNPQFAELVGLMHETDDPALLEGYFAEAEQILAAEVPFIPLYVRAETFEVEGSLRVTATADGAGDWTADFSGVFDLVAGTEGGAFEYDDDGDRTQGYWRVPDPAFQVSAGHDLVAGGDFEPGGTTTITFDDNQDPGDGTLFETTTELDPDGGGFFIWWFAYNPEFDVEVGQYVTVTDGTTTKSTRVADTAVTAVDEVADTVSGVATPGAAVEVEAQGGEGQAKRFVTADETTGEWVADFGVAVEGGEGDPFDLGPGTLVVASEADDDGDATIFVEELFPLIDGRVLADGVPVAGAEVFSHVNRRVCTDDHGYFTFTDASMVWPLTSGNQIVVAVHNPASTCPNPGLLDADGKPLLGEPYIGIDPFTGYNYIELHLEHAAAYQTILVDEFDGTAWVPVGDVWMTVYDRADPDFVAAFGADPDPAQYPDILEAGVGELFRIHTVEDDGAEPRYTAATDVLILVEMPDGSIMGDQTDSTEFVDRGDGVLVGPTIVFPNQPPEITQVTGPEFPLLLGTAATIAVEFTDRNVHDAHTVSFVWGDGTEPTSTGEHTYAATGIYEVEVTVTDAGGLSDTQSFRYLVVYDPTGGFVTGGGWFHPAASSDYPGMDPADRVNLGFNVKYKNNSTEPQGELNIQLGDLHVHSDSIDWLVITIENEAYFSGLATIDGGPDLHPFRVNVFDGDADVQPDWFELLIFAPGADPYDDPPLHQVRGNLQGGQVKIHQS